MRPDLPLRPSGRLKAPAARPPALVELRSLHRAYDSGPPALDYVSLTVARDSFCVILGASGSGKTTLLKSIIGLGDPGAGTIILDGEPLTRATLRKARQSIGMVHQDFGLTERLTSIQNVMAGAAFRAGIWRYLLQLYPQPVIRKACALLARVGIGEQQANRRVRALSGGQKQRIGIARALINDPVLLLADEPVASLDPQTAEDVMTLLKEAARERGASVICSLHQIELARAFADRIIGLRHGKVVFDGPPQQLDREAMARIFGTGTENPTPAMAAACQG